MGIAVSPTLVEVKSSRMVGSSNVPFLCHFLDHTGLQNVELQQLQLHLICCFFWAPKRTKTKKHVLNLDLLTQFILCSPSCRCASATCLAPMPGPKDLPQRKVQRCATKVTGPFPTCEGNDMVVGQGNNFLCIYIAEQTQRNTTLKDSSYVLNVHLKSAQNHILDEED